MSIKIKSFRGRYFFLSNFFICPIMYEGISYTSAKSAFQATKCEDIERRQEFSNLDPSKAKRKGNSVRLRNDWEKIKIGIMYEIVKEKFIQNSGLLKALLETEDAYLEEGNTWGDDEWGTVNGKGKNKLGKILMKVRKELEEDAGKK